MPEIFIEPVDLVHQRLVFGLSLPAVRSPESPLKTRRNQFMAPDPNQDDSPCWTAAPPAACVRPTMSGSGSAKKYAAAITAATAHMAIINNFLFFIHHLPDILQKGSCRAGMTP